MKNVLLLVALAVSALAADKQPSSTTIKAHIIDSACAYTKSLDKPVSVECATKCAKNGSPLVLLTQDGTVLLPIDDKTPSSSQNSKLLPYAGKLVTVTGKVFERKGGKAIVIEKIVE